MSTMISASLPGKRMVHAPSPTCACRQRFPGNLRVARRLRVLAQGTSDYATGQRLASFAAASLVLLNVAGPSLAAQKVGEFGASGIFFKDSVETVAIEDEEVQGVTIWISDFQRSLADKLSNFFSEPSQASVTCAITGPIVIKDVNRIRGMEGNEVFSERRGLGLFQNKTLRVRRIFDEAHKTLLYIAYSTRLTNDKGETPGRYKTSVCALPISPSVAPIEKTASNESSGLFN